MKTLSEELKKLDSYTGIEYGQRVTDLYKDFPNDREKIYEYIENRVYDVATSADEAIAKCARYQFGEIA